MASIFFNFAGPAALADDVVKGLPHNFWYSFGIWSHDFAASLPQSLVVTTLACVLGAVLYRFFIALALNSDFIGLKAQDLNLVTAVLVALALLVPAWKRKLPARRVATRTVSSIAAKGVR